MTTTTPVDCDAVAHPGEQAGTGTITVLTLDPSAGSTLLGTTSVSADGSMVYASTDRLYVATTAGRVVVGRRGEEVRTDLHGFDTSAPDAPPYVGSGGVDGWLLGPWARTSTRGTCGSAPRCARRRRGGRARRRGGRPHAPRARARRHQLQRRRPRRGRRRSRRGRAGRRPRPRGADPGPAVVRRPRRRRHLRADRPAVHRGPRRPGPAARARRAQGARLLRLPPPRRRRPAARRGPGRHPGPCSGRRSRPTTSPTSPHRARWPRSCWPDSSCAVEWDSRQFAYLPGSRTAVLPLDRYTGETYGSGLVAVAVGEDGCGARAGRGRRDGGLGRCGLASTEDLVLVTQERWQEDTGVPNLALARRARRRRPRRAVVVDLG